ncbi:MAG TPA: GNAT family N-acetyltransferase [Ignavibacteria bacterium]|nr:GNAT family N-acetyltransferase [Ignavibacteria bacterium]
MNIHLKEIKEENWRDCISLRVRKDQERFVATNENGLALAYAHKEMEPSGIYNDEKMVGFVMFAKDPDEGIYYINRLMTDERYQGNSYGRKALEIVIGILKERGAKFIDIIHKPDNFSAIKLCRSLGFEPTDEKLNEDMISGVNFN